MTAKDLYITLVKLGETQENAYRDTFSQGVFSPRELRELQNYYYEKQLRAKVG